MKWDIAYMCPHQLTNLHPDLSVNSSKTGTNKYARQTHKTATFIDHSYHTLHLSIFA